MPFGGVSYDEVYYNHPSDYLDHDEQVTMALYRKELAELKDGK